MDPTKMFDLTGRRALVTGASRGIGRVLALSLAACGARVAVHYYGSADAAKEVTDQIPGGCMIKANLAQQDAAEQIYTEAAAHLGDIDILVLNASVQYRADDVNLNAKLDRDKFHEQVNVNLRSSIELTQLCVPAMVQHKWGRILAVGSVQQYRPHPQMLTYAATKSALENAVRNLAKQLAPHGVTVNNLSPGIIATDRNANALADDTYRKQVLAAIPMHQIGQTQDCIAAAMLLLTDAGRYITGIDLPVDGGLRLP